MQKIASKSKCFDHYKKHSQLGKTNRQKQYRQLAHVSSLGMMLGHRKTQSLKTDAHQRPTFGCITPANNRTRFKNGFCFKIPELSKHEDLDVDSSDMDIITSIHYNSKQSSYQQQFLRNQLQEIILRNQELTKKCKQLQHDNILEKQKLQKLNGKASLITENLRLKQQLHAYQRQIPISVIQEFQALKKQNNELRQRMKTNHQKYFRGK